MANNKSYKLNTAKMTNNNEKRDHNTGVSDGTKKLLKNSLMTVLWSKRSKKYLIKNLKNALIKDLFKDLKKCLNKRPKKYLIKDLKTYLNQRSKKVS